MADRELHVKITGDASSLQKAASEGEQATESFGQKAAGVLKGLAAFAAGSALAQFFRSASDAVVEFEGSTRKLEATAKITGTALGTLQGIAERGQKGFGLSATLANDYAVELAKLASKAGDVGKATPLLGAFLDLGAARGLSAGETLKAVQQAILGIDEGTDKLFNKNPSVLYKEYADAIGTTAGKLTDQQKAIALVNAALVDGGKVGGEYNSYLDSYGGKLSMLSVRYQEFLVQVGKAVFETEAGKTVTNELVGALVKLRQWVEANEDSIGNLAGAIGRTVVSVGNFIGKLVELVRWFDTHVPTLDSWWQAVTGGKDVKRRAEDTTKIVTTENGNMLEFLAWAEKRKVKVQQESEEERAKSLREFHKDVEAQARINEANVYLVLAEARKKLRTLNEQTAKDWLTLYDNAERAHNTLTGLLPIPPAVAKSLEDAAFNAREMGDAFYNPNAPAAEGGVTEKADKATDAALGVARAFIDVGTATGTFSREMGSALGSVLNMVSAMGRLGVDPLGGITGIVAGLASAITGFASNPQAKMLRELHAKNIEALEKNTLELGNFNLGSSGKTFNATQVALQAAKNAIKGLNPNTGQKRTDDLIRGDVARKAFIASLIKAGVNPQDAFTLLDAIGVQGLSDASDPTKFLAGLGSATDNLSQIEFGKFDPNNFQDQLKALTEGFGILGVTDADQKLSDFRDLVKRFSPALADALNVDLTTPEGLAKATANLQALFVKLRTGGLTAAQIGVTGPEFLSLIQTILGLIGESDGLNPSAVGAGVGTPTGGPDPVPGTGTGTSGLVTPNGGVPTVSSGAASVPTTITTTVTNPVLNFNFPDVYDSREAAEAVAQRVSEILGLDYVRQRTALGLN